LYSYENKLIISCLVEKKNDEILRRIQKIFDRPLDWSYILNIAQKAKVAPLFYNCLQELGYADRLPAETKRKLQQIVHQNGLRNLLYYQELKNILISFKALEIETIVLKGAVLAEVIWQNVSLRHMWDIDLLVREKDLVGSEKKLLEMGYISSEPLHPKDWFKNNQHLPPFCNPRNGVITELHTDITTPKNRFLLMPETWGRAWPIKLSGADTFMLCPDDLIIHLCIHLAYMDHMVGKLRNLTDIAKILEFYKTDFSWEWIVRRAYERDFVSYMYYPLFLAKEILNADIEEEILKDLHGKSRLTNMEDKLLKGLIRRNILMGDGTSGFSPEQRIQRVLSQTLLSNDRIILKMLRLLKSIFIEVPAKSGWKSGPKPLFLLYPIYRIFEISWKLIFRSFSSIYRLFQHRERLQIPS